MQLNNFEQSAVDRVRYLLTRYRESSPLRADITHSHNSTPASLFKAAKESGAVLDLSGLSMGDNVFAIILPEVVQIIYESQSQTKIIGLDLGSNRLKLPSIQRLYDSLPMLESLNISENRFCNNQMGSVCKLLAQMSTLRYVDISNNRVVSTDIEKLYQSPSLTSVNFQSHYAFRDFEAVDIVRRAKLAAACEYNKHLSLQPSSHADHCFEQGKDEYIRANVHKWVKELVRHDKAEKQYHARSHGAFFKPCNHAQMHQMLVESVETLSEDHTTSQSKQVK